MWIEEHVTIGWNYDKTTWDNYCLHWGDCDKWQWVRWLMEWDDMCRMVVCKEKKEKVSYTTMCTVMDETACTIVYAKTIKNWFFRTRNFVLDAWSWIILACTIMIQSMIERKQTKRSMCFTLRKSGLHHLPLGEEILSIKCFHWSLSRCSMRSLETCTHNSIA